MTRRFNRIGRCSAGEEPRVIENKITSTVIMATKTLWTNWVVARGRRWPSKGETVRKLETKTTWQAVKVAIVQALQIPQSWAWNENRPNSGRKSWREDLLNLAQSQGTLANRISLRKVSKIIDWCATMIAEPCWKFHPQIHKTERIKISKKKKLGDKITIKTIHRVPMHVVTHNVSAV